MKTTTWATWALWATCHLSGFLVVALTVFVALVPGWAAPAPEVAEETFKDRRPFIPRSDYQPLQGKVIGVLASDVAGVMSHEGRHGFPDAYGFGMNGNSYCWVYVPAADQGIVKNLQVKTGERGDEVKVYPKLNMANPETVKQWGFTSGYALVEIEVNDGLGAPADESFVATKMTRLDGTKDYPFKVAEVVDAARKQYDGWMRDHERVVKDAMAQAQTKAVKEVNKDAKPTPREPYTIMYVTWMTDTQKLQVRFLTRMSAEVFQEGPLTIDVGPDDDPKLPRRPPKEFRAGIVFGIEFGVAYEISRSGIVEKILKLPIKSFEDLLLVPAKRDPLDKE
jgi:hypothetical protein